jgi:hypothetical protein
VPRILTLVQPKSSDAVVGARMLAIDLVDYLGANVPFFPGLVPPTVYYSRVALELSKVVFEARKMSPP